MEPADNPQAEACQAEAALPRQHVLPPVSWLVLGTTDSHQVARSKSQIGQGVKDLRACRNISGPGLCQRSLRRRNIEQTAHAVAVRFDSRGVGLAGGFEKCGGRLPLPQCSLYIRIASPYLIGNLIQSDFGLGRSRIAICLGLQQIVLSSSSVKNGPIDSHGCRARQSRHPSCRKLFLPSILKRSSHRRLELYRRVVSRVRLSYRSLRSLDPL